jgi:hypothetical protein
MVMVRTTSFAVPLCFWYYGAIADCRQANFSVSHNRSGSADLLGRKASTLLGWNLVPGDQRGGASGYCLMINVAAKLITAEIAVLDYGRYFPPGALPLRCQCSRGTRQRKRTQIRSVKNTCPDNAGIWQKRRIRVSPEHHETRPPVHRRFCRSYSPWQMHTSLRFRCPTILRTIPPTALTRTEIEQVALPCGSLMVSLSWRLPSRQPESVICNRKVWRTALWL